MEDTNDQGMENNDGGEDGEDICAICLEDVRDWKKGGEEEKKTMYYFTCDQKKVENDIYHVFHQKCIHEWFQRSGKKSCPLCRSQCKDGTIYGDVERDVGRDVGRDIEEEEENDDDDDDDEWYFRNRYRNTFEIFGMRFYWWSVSVSIFCTVLLLKYTLIMFFILEMFLVKALILSSLSTNLYNTTRGVYDGSHPQYPEYPEYPIYPEYSFLSMMNDTFQVMDYS
jgi:hypothetical protein